MQQQQFSPSVPNWDKATSVETKQLCSLSQWNLSTGMNRSTILAMLHSDTNVKFFQVTDFVLKILA